MAVHGALSAFSAIKFRWLSLVAMTATFFMCIQEAVPSAQSTITVVMSGLDNPRGLAFGPEGGLYVVEAGRGGDGPCQVLRNQMQCYGPTGALSRLWRGSQERVITGLPSYAMANGEATGPHDISFLGRGGGFLTVGFGADPALRAGFGEVGGGFGTLLQLQPSANESWRVLADMAGHEAATNPDAGPVDSNPYGILALPGGRLVTDAGANALLHLKANGDISTLAVFPSSAGGRTTDSVPTTVVTGPDGAYYVGELTGVPFAAGAARVYRVVPGHAPEIVHDGFKTIIDIDFGPDGSLYVLQHATGAFFAGLGQLIRVNPDGARAVVVAGLTRPASVLVDADRTIYLSNRSTSAGTGEVLRIEH
jgi:hypothetical protein